MNLLNLFRPKEKHSLPTVLGAGATFYPDRILIDTVDRVKEGFGLSSAKVTVLAVDATPETIGSTLRRHLALTKHGLSIPKDYKAHYREFLVAAGLKNDKERHKGAKHLMVSQKNGLISIAPTHNGGATGKDRGFRGIKGVTNIEVRQDISDAELGEQIKAAWELCTISGV